MDELNKLLQAREREILLASDYNLASFTGADVIKLLARATPIMEIELLKEVMQQALDILFTVPELAQDLLTKFDDLTLILAAVMFVLAKNDMSETVQSLIHLIESLNLDIDMVTVHKYVEDIQEMTRKSDQV